MKTLALDESWDLGIDEYNNIAVKSDNDRLAQDVASSVRVFLGELPFDINRGVDYNNPDSIREDLKIQINEQAALVEGVNESLVVFDELKDRTLKTTIYITNENGEQVVVGEQNVRAN